MDPLYENSEAQMRDKMLRHEFSFEDQDWQQMESLLDEDKRGPAFVVAPQQGVAIDKAAQATALDKIKKAKWLLLLLLLVGAGISYRSTDGIENNAIDGSAALRPVPATKAIQSTSLSANLEQPQSQQVRLPEAPRAKGGSDRPYIAPLPRVKVPNAQAAESKHPTTQTRGAAVSKEEVQSGTLQNPDAAASAEPEMPQAPLQNDNKETVNPDLAPSLKSNMLAPSALELLMSIPKAVKSMSRDSLKQPFKPRTSAPARKKLQSALIVGINANMTNYSTGMVSVLPHAGFSLGYSLSPRWTLQAELVAKLVRGYGFESRLTYDVLNVAKNEFDLKGNNLLFFEFPLLLKRTNARHPNQDWYAGIKPALVYPVLKSDVEKRQSNSVTPAFNFDIADSIILDDGIRRWDVGLTLGYEWRFSRSGALDIRANAGLLDLTADNFFKNTAYHLNTDLQLAYRCYFR